MSKKNIRWWVDGAYDFLILLTGIVVLLPFVIVFSVISTAGAIIGLSRSSSFDPSISMQGRRMTGTTFSLSENEERFQEKDTRREQMLNTFVKNNIKQILKLQQKEQY